MSRFAHLAAWTLGIAAFGFFVIGGLLYSLPVGLDWSAYPLGGLIESLFRLFYHGPNAIAAVFWLAVALLGLIVVTYRFGSRPAAGTDATRRSVLRGGAAAFGATALASGIGGLRAFLGFGEKHGGWNTYLGNVQVPAVQTHPEYPEEWKGARIDPDTGYRRLGRTHWPVSDIVVGAGRIGRLVGERKGVEIVRRAIDRGVNYVDTSPDYSATGSESAVADAIKGQRDRVFLATKFCTPWGHLGAGAPVAEYKRIIEESLARLGTDYADLAHVHACDTVERLLDPNLHEAVDRLKQEGKLRYLGFSSHTPNLVEVVEAAIDSGRFDVMMLAYHHGAWPEMPALIDRAVAEQDMGVVAMKTLKGAKHQDLTAFRDHAPAYSQAALKWVLSNPNVSAAIISFFEFQHVDEYLQASGRRITPHDVSVLEEYDRQIAGTHCTPHCGACLSSCPEQLAIHDVLRHRMYFEDYGDEKEAMRLYAKLEKDASVCAGCSAPCAGRCPVGIPIQERMAGAHSLLTLG